MSFFELRKKKTDIDDLMRRAEEFMESAGMSYEKSLQQETSKDIALASLSLKIGKGEGLVKELAEKASLEEDSNAKVLLEQLSLAVSGELKNLFGIKQAYLSLDVAEKTREVLDREEMLRKIKSGMEEYAGQKNSE